jgi:MAF protein
MQRTLVLASSSSYRRQLLLRLLPSFQSRDPAIDESRGAGESPAALVQRLALNKALRLAPDFDDALIIGADQVACGENEFLGKPGNLSRAREQLRHCSGKTVTFYTGLCLLDTRTDDYDIACETYQVRFRTLSDAEIEAYLQVEQPFDCAGSFKSEGLGINLFEALQGKDPNTLIGLPLITLAGWLRRRGVNPLLLHSSAAASPGTADR